MEIIKLRILTRLSKLRYGKFYEYKVSELLTIMNRGSYLRWSYYNLSSISFSSDVLYELGIIEEYRIIKPGTCPEMYDEMKDAMLLDYKPTFFQVAHNLKRDRKRRLSINIQRDNQDYKLNNRGLNQRRNQGL